MTHNLNDVLNQATKKIAALIQKTVQKASNVDNRIGRAAEDLEALIKGGELD